MTAAEVDIAAIAQSANGIAVSLDEFETDLGLIQESLGLLVAGITSDSEDSLLTVLRRQAEAQERIADALEKMLEGEIEVLKAEVSE